MWQYSWKNAQTLQMRLCQFFAKHYILELFVFASLALALIQEFVFKHIAIQYEQCFQQSNVCKLLVKLVTQFCATFLHQFLSCYFLHFFQLCVLGQCHSRQGAFLWPWTTGSVHLVLFVVSTRFLFCKFVFVLILLSFSVGNSRICGLQA